MKRIINVRLRSGISSDGFEVSVTDGDETSEWTRYDYGYNCSYDRALARDDKPYVGNILQDLVNEHHAGSINITAGKNVFKDKDVEQDRIETFRHDYCESITFPDEEMDFADAVASITEDGPLMGQ